MYKQTIALLLLLSISVSGQVPEKTKVVAGAERAFEKAAKTNSGQAPGCAVGVSLNGESVFENAFGLAEMEHQIPNTPQTIFESGSVAKQFTAAALVLLERDDKLKLDDDVRKYVPELPIYGRPITIRHLLTHTSGIRDWGSVLELTGAGRLNRVITQELAFDVIIRQKGLDFEPGAEYSYSNGGYQLAVVIVERVSGQKFTDFTRDRIFKPLGMSNTSWRDDYRRLVKGRAQAYTRSGQSSPWMLSMPFMNVVGNGGMLTTVGDLLKWNAALDSNAFGARFVETLETPAQFNDGRKVRYALGLTPDNYKGLRAVGHTGSTAGYQTFVGRFPEPKLSIASLCNGSSPSSTAVALSIADEIFGPFPPSSEPSRVEISPEVLQKYTGVWRDERTRSPVRLAVENGDLTLNGSRLQPVGDGVFTYGYSRVEFTETEERGLVGREIDENGLIHPFFREPEWMPNADDLKAIAGTWHSEEAQATFTLVIDGGKALLTQRPSLKLPLEPLYKDHFSAGRYVVWFTRDKDNKILELHIGGFRLRDMPFAKR